MIRFIGDGVFITFLYSDVYFYYFMHDVRFGLVNFCYEIIKELNRTKRCIFLYVKLLVFNKYCYCPVQILALKDMFSIIQANLKIK